MACAVVVLSHASSGKKKKYKLGLSHGISRQALEGRPIGLGSTHDWNWLKLQGFVSADVPHPLLQRLHGKLDTYQKFSRVAVSS
jgi:hypothetical protein